MFLNSTWTSFKNLVMLDMEVLYLIKFFVNLLFKS